MGAPVGLEYKTALWSPVLDPMLELEMKELGVLDTPDTPVHTPTQVAEGAKEVTAVVAVTGVRDDVGDVLVPGAFKQSLLDRPKPKVCLGHDWNRPIGKTLWIKELLPGEKGLPLTTYDGKPWPKEAGAVIARYAPDMTADGAAAYNSAKFFGPEESTFSFGFKTQDARHSGNTRYVKRVAMYEYGPVLVPANRLATLQDIKAAVDAGEIEEKSAQVRDVAYWGLPYGTAITTHVHPHGPKARAERRQGRVPSRSVGVMQAGQAAKAPKPAERNAEIAGTGLFAEPESGARVLPHPTRAKGNDQEHIDSLAKGIGDGGADADADGDGAERVAVDKAIRGLLDEGITPAEVHERIASHPLIDAPGEQRNYQDGEPGSHAEGMNNALSEYAARYAGLAAQQRANTPAPAPASQFEHLSNAALAGHRDATTQILQGLEKDGAGPGDPLHRNATAHLAGVEQVMAARRAAAAENPIVATSHAIGLRYHQHDAATAEQRAQEMQAQLEPLRQEQAASPSEQGTPDEALPYSIQALVHGLRGRNADGSEREPQAEQTPTAPTKVPTGQTSATEAGDAPYSVVTKGKREATVDYQGNHYTVANHGGLNPGVTVTDPDGYQTHASGGDKTLPLRDRGPDRERAVRQALRSAHARFTGTPAPADTSESGRRLTGERATTPTVVETGAGGTPSKRRAPAPVKPKTADKPSVVADTPDVVPAEPATPPYTVVSKGKRQATVDYQGTHYQVEHSGGVLAGATVTDPAGNRTTVRGGGTTLLNMDRPRDLERAVREALHTAHLRYTGDTTNDGKPGGNPSSNASAALHANTLMRMGNKDARAHLGTLGKSTLTDIDAELSDRAQTLGKPGVVTDKHQMVRDALATAPDEPLSIYQAGSKLADTEAETRASMHGRYTDQEAGNAVDARTRELAAAMSSPTTGAATEHGRALRPLMDDFATGQQTGEGAAGFEHAAGRMTEQQRAERADHAERAGRILQESGAGTDANNRAGMELHRYARGLRDRSVLPDTSGNTATIEPAALDEVANGMDESLGLHEHPDGMLEVEPDIAARQDRVADLLHQHETGALDLGGKTTDELHTTRQDLSAELRLQNELARRDTANPPGRRASTATPPTAPDKPKMRAGLAGAAEDHAEALRSGDAEAINRTQARLESSLRRTRANSDVARQLADHVSGGDMNAGQLATLAGSLRTEARLRRNASSRKRATAKRLDRDRINSVLGSVDAELRGRGDSPEVTTSIGAPTGVRQTVGTGSSRVTTGNLNNVRDISDEQLDAEHQAAKDRFAAVRAAGVPINSAARFDAKRAVTTFVDEKRRRATIAAAAKPESTAPERNEWGELTPLTDEQYEKHTRMVANKLNAALSTGQSTDVVHTKGGKGKVYTPERAALHKEIVDSVWNLHGASVPREGKSIVAGGLMGAGKTTVLKDHAGVDTSRYLTIDPDALKQEFIDRNMMPHVKGLSPMEAAPLLHEESAHVAKLLAQKAYRNKTNVIWDVSMSSKESMDKRIEKMNNAGYSKPEGIFVDIPVETSVSRAELRHRTGLEDFRNGIGSGGRYVPPLAIRKQSHSEASSANRHVFDQLADQFDSSAVFDNSHFGQSPTKVTGKGRWGVGDTGLATLSDTDTPEEHRTKLAEHHQWIQDNGPSHSSAHLVQSSLATDTNSPQFVHLSGSDPAAVNAAHKMIISDMWPEIRRGTEHTRAPYVTIRQEDANPSFNEHVGESGPAATYSPGPHLISIAPRTLDSAHRGSAHGFYSETGDAPLALRSMHHEYGHALDDALTKDQRDAMFHAIGKSMDDRRNRFSKLVKGDSGASEIGKSKSAREWVRENKAALINAVGTYAGTDDHELIAELWSEYRLAPKPSDLAKIVGKHLTAAKRE